MLCVTLTVSSATAQARPKAGQEIHPVRELVVRDARSTSEVRVGETRSGFAANVAGLEERASVGVLDGPEAYVLGRIADVELDAEGRIYILDRHANELRLYDAGGRYLHRVGGPGTGPGRYRRVQAVAVASDRVYVSDISRRVEIYRVAGDSLIHLESVSLDMAALALCVVGDTLVVQGPTTRPGGATVHLFDSSGRRLTQFAQLYRSNALVAYELSRAHMACATDPRRIALATGLGDVRLYDQAGALQWVATVADYRHPIISADQNEYSVRMPSDGWHRVYGVAFLPSGNVLAQIALATVETQEAGVDHVRLISLVLDARTGRPLGVYDDAPPLWLITGSRALSVEQGPYPRVRLLQVANP